MPKGVRSIPRIYTYQGKPGGVLHPCHTCGVPTLRMGQADPVLCPTHLAAFRKLRDRVWTERTRPKKGSQ